MAQCALQLLRVVQHLCAQLHSGCVPINQTTASDSANIQVESRQAWHIVRCSCSGLCNTFVPLWLQICKSDPTRQFRTHDVCLERMLDHTHTHTRTHTGMTAAATSIDNSQLAALRSGHSIVDDEHVLLTWEFHLPASLCCSESGLLWSSDEHSS